MNYLFLEFTIYPKPTYHHVEEKGEAPDYKKGASTRLAPTINGDEVAYIFELDTVNERGQEPALIGRVTQTALPYF